MLKSAAVAGKVRTVTLVAKIRQKILQSKYPKAVIYMRKIDALRQECVYIREKYSEIEENSQEMQVRLIISVTIVICYNQFRSQYRHYI